MCVRACPCVCVLMMMCVYVYLVCTRPEWGRGGEGREGVRRRVGGGEWGLVCMWAYEIVLCEIKHANCGLF